MALLISDIRGISKSLVTSNYPSYIIYIKSVSSPSLINFLFLIHLIFLKLLVISSNYPLFKYLKIEIYCIKSDFLFKK